MLYYILPQGPFSLINGDIFTPTFIATGAGALNDTAVTTITCREQCFIKQKYM